MSYVTRIGDTVNGTCNVNSNHGDVTGTIVSGSTIFFDDSKGIARVGDLVQFSCGHTGYIVSGSTIFFDDSKGIARVGDLVDGDVTGTIVTGSPIFSIER